MAAAVAAARGAEGRDKGTEAGDRDRDMDMEARDTAAAIQAAAADTSAGTVVAEHRSLAAPPASPAGEEGTSVAAVRAPSEQVQRQRVVGGREKR